GAGISPVLVGAGPRPRPGWGLLIKNMYGNDCMNMRKKEIEKLLQQNESVTLEFKESRRGLSKSVFQTLCAFLNRSGGVLLLGASDAGKVVGVLPEALPQIKKDLVTTFNNSQKIHPPCYLSLEEIEMEGKKLLYIYVPESSQVHRCNGRIYDRNEDGDLDITDHTNLVAEMYRRKQSSYSENKIYPHASLADLREDLVSKVQKIAGIQRKNHPWLHLEYFEFLQSAQLYQKDLETGKSGITLAGILLLGKDSSILSVVPHHRTDLILRKKNLDRYDDRDDVRTNLIESYERIMAFGAKHLPDPFFLEGDQRISLRDAILREVASNILIHREYVNPFPAKLIIEEGQVFVENSNKPHGFGRINPEKFSPFPKNPVIARFFKELGRADELGSGVRNLMKYGKIFGGKLPELIEGDVFTTLIYLPSTTEATTEVATEATTEAALLSVLCGEMSRKELQKALGLKNDEYFRKKYLLPALEKGFLARTIPGKPKSPLQRYRLTEKGKKKRAQLLSTEETVGAGLRPRPGMR
ncbi:MAG TPA: putative DNA binding domain-containing protein, partial [Synergistaceae bacterium]|nr:putative DNA binding domain-containing protein [Synergistaceae bacterium]